MPKRIKFEAAEGRVMKVTATGTTYNGTGAPPSPPDGNTETKPVNVNSYGGISGVSGGRQMSLLAVFLGPGEPDGKPRSEFDYSNTTFTQTSPGLRRTFFVGDGLTGTGSGAQQLFKVPPTATRVFFGFADAYGNGPGDPGYYDDNTGSFNVIVKISGKPKPKIAGRVVDGRGHGIPAVRIKAKGPADLSANTDFKGFYSIDVPNKKRGKYVVTPHNDDQRFKPEQRRVDLDRNSSAEANFTGLCPTKRGRTAAGSFRPPANGLYGGEGPVEVYYSCANGTVRARMLAMQLTCTDGRVRSFNSLTAGKAKLSSRSFITDELHQNVNLSEDSGASLYDIRAEVTGDFRRANGSDLVDTRYTVRAFSHKSGIPDCRATGRSRDLRLFERDPSPFN